MESLLNVWQQGHNLPNNTAEKFGDVIQLLKKINYKYIDFEKYLQCKRLNSDTKVHTKIATL